MQLSNISIVAFFVYYDLYCFCTGLIFTALQRSILRTLLIFPNLWNGKFRIEKYGYILMTEKAIYHKDIKAYDESTGSLILSSRNPLEEDFEISINEVYRIFNVIKRTF